MKPIALLCMLTLAVGTPLVFAAHDHEPALQVTAPDAMWLAKAKAEYPLKTCVVSEEEFGGDMGEAVDYIYKQEGQPDRLIRFCCKKCSRDFTKAPAQYLKKIDEAAAKTKKS